MNIHLVPLCCLLPLAIGGCSTEGDAGKAFDTATASVLAMRPCSRATDAMAASPKPHVRTVVTGDVATRRAQRDDLTTPACHW